jgi:hypothetical protein
MYRIFEWAKRFENNQTRELKSLSWIRLPAKLGGSGYTRIAARKQKDGPAIFGCFVSLLELASQCAPRGAFCDSAGTAYDEETMADMTRMPLPLVKTTLAFLSSKPFDWIEIVDDAAVGPVTAEENSRVVDDTKLSSVKRGSRSIQARCHHDVVFLTEDEYVKMRKNWGRRFTDAAIVEYSLKVKKGDKAAKHLDHNSGILDYVRRGYLCAGMRKEPETVAALPRVPRPDEERFDISGMVKEVQEKIGKRSLVLTKPVRGVCAA